MNVFPVLLICLIFICQTASSATLQTDVTSTTRIPVKDYTWTGRQSCGGFHFGPIAITSRYYGSYDLFGRGTDNKIYQNKNVSPGNVGTTWFKLDDNQYVAPPSVTSPETGIIHLAVVYEDLAVYIITQNGDKWGSYETVGGDTDRQPGIVSPYKDQIDVFMMSLGRGLLQRTKKGASWGAWKELDTGDFIITSGLSAVSRRPGHIELSAVARSKDNMMSSPVLRSFDGTKWGPWVRLSGYGASSAITKSSPDRTELFVIGGGGRLYGATVINNKIEGNYYQFPGYLPFYGPAAASAVTGKLAVTMAEDGICGIIFGSY